MSTPITNFDYSVPLQYTAAGQPYQEDPRIGTKRYISPMEAAGLVEAAHRGGRSVDPKLAKWAGGMGASISPDTVQTGNPDAQGGFLHKGYNWDERGGDWQGGGLDWGNLIAGGLLGAGAGSAAYGAATGPTVAQEVAGVASHGAAPSLLGSTAPALAGVTKMATAGGNPILDAILGGGSVLAHLWGGHQASNAAKQAAKTQAESAQKAMDLATMLFGQQKQAFQPYQDAGTAAVGRLNDYLTGQKPQPMPASMQQFLGNGALPAAPQPRLISANPMLAGPPQNKTVKMIDPAFPQDVRDIPADQASHWIQKGAQVVG